MFQPELSMGATCTCTHPPCKAFSLLETAGEREVSRDN